MCNAIYEIGTGSRIARLRMLREVSRLVFNGLKGTYATVPVSIRLRTRQVRNGPITRSVASGFIAALVAAVLCYSFSPQHPVSVGSALARAIAYIVVLFGTVSITTYLAGKGRTSRNKEIALCIAATAIWLPPLLMFYVQSSWFVLILFAAFAVDLARLVAFFRSVVREPGPAPAETQLEAHLFSLLSQTFPYSISMLGVFMLQGAIFAALGTHVVLAAIFYLAGTSAIAVRSFQMFRDLSDASPYDARPGNPIRHTWIALVSAILLMVFAWLPYIAVSGRGNRAGTLPGTGGTYLEGPGSGSGIGNRRHRAQRKSSVSDWLQSLLRPEVSSSHGDSFEVAKQLLESSLPKSREEGANRRNRSNDANIRITEPIVGPIFPAVELYPDEHRLTKLVAPPAELRSGRGTGNSEPFSIPFDGVYWFWRGPSDQPPKNSVRLHGNPSAHFFRSTDGDLMSMEARQNLGFAVDPRRYSAIEVEIQNADPFPGSVSLALKIRNTAANNKPCQNLGLEKVPSAASATNGANQQMLRFHIPSRLAMGSFDELTVSYFLRGDRGNRSARIAIERFRFVPRG